MLSNIIQWRPSFFSLKVDSKAEIFTVNYSQWDLSLCKVSNRNLKIIFFVIPEGGYGNLLYQYLKNSIFQRCRSLKMNYFRIFMIFVSLPFKKKIGSQRVKCDTAISFSELVHFRGKMFSPYENFTENESYNLSLAFSFSLVGNYQLCIVKNKNIWVTNYETIFTLTFVWEKWETFTRLKQLQAWMNRKIYILNSILRLFSELVHFRRKMFSLYENFTENENYYSGLPNPKFKNQ